ncbi:MAG TPA: lysophospholipid acyltransferase family protein [Casimicrobiaceae bacterium]
MTETRVVAPDDAPAALGNSASAPRRVARAARSLVHVLEGIATTTFVFPRATPGRRRALIQRWSVRLLRILRVQCRVHGSLEPDGGNLLIVANHVSWLDIVVLNAVCPVRFVAKAELARWPLAGRLARGAGTLFIERARRRDTHRVNRTVTEALAGGDVVAIFPEGTTSDGASVLPFKSSLLQAVVDAGGQVQPLALCYRTPDGARSTAPAYVGDDTFVASFWRVCGAAALNVDLVPLARVPAAGRHRRAVADDAEAAIRQALDRPASGSELGRPGDPRAGSR